MDVESIWPIGLLALLTLLAWAVVFLAQRRLSALMAKHSETMDAWGQARAERMAAEQGGQDLLQQQLRTMREVLGQQVLDVRQALDLRLGNLSGTMSAQIGAQAQVIAQVHGELGGLRESAKRVGDLGQEMSALGELLRAPKSRGMLGEWLLEEILSEVLPKQNYALQERLWEGDSDYVIVDAVIKLRDRYVPIDAKFPLESFERLMAAPSKEERAVAKKKFIDVLRKHVDVVAQKYVRPDAGTYDFALLYLPAESLYYEAISRDAKKSDDILAYAAKHHVVLVSPTTLYAYLLTIGHGLRGLQIEERAAKLGEHLAVAQKRLQDAGKAFQKVGRHLDLAHRNFSVAQNKMLRADEVMAKITGQQAWDPKTPLEGLPSDDLNQDPTEPKVSAA